MTESMPIVRFVSPTGFAPMASSKRPTGEFTTQGFPNNLATMLMKTGEVMSPKT